jgi:hypothetical protein
MFKFKANFRKKGIADKNKKYIPLPNDSDQDLPACSSGLFSIQKRFLRKIAGLALNQ